MCNNCNDSSCISEILTGDSFTLLDSTVLKNVTYSAQPMSLEQIPYEKLTSDPSLLCSGHGIHLPSIFGVKKPEQDANLFDRSGLIGREKVGASTVEDEIFDFDVSNAGYQIWKDVAPGSIVGSIGHVNINIKGDAIAALNAAAYWTHVNDNNPLQGTTTHTIGRYNSYLRKGTVAESYILAHEKNTAFYADYVQLALWYLLGQEGNSDLGTKVQDQRIGRNLYQEAMGLQNAVIAQEAFVASNMGKKIVDQTNYWMNNG